MTHPKRPRDPNQLAKSIIDIATGQKPDRDPTPEEQGKVPLTKRFILWSFFKLTHYPGAVIPEIKVCSQCAVTSLCYFGSHFLINRILFWR